MSFTDPRNLIRTYGGHTWNGKIEIHGSAHLGDQHVTIMQNAVGEEERQWQRLLDSLRHSKMMERLNDIKPTHAGTFKWLFDEQSYASGEINMFLDWLGGIEPSFIIQGKAGSGKSTLMKLIYDRIQHLEHLRAWSGSTTVHVVFHSFWRVGTKLQQNFRGFLASILYQLLSKSAGLFTAIQIWRGHEARVSLEDWSEDNLEALLRRVISTAGLSILLLIDGLDEFDEEHRCDRLLDTLDGIVEAASHLKMCIATRPFRDTPRQFENSPNLLLQNHTSRDIEKYVMAELRKKLRPRPEDQIARRQICQLTNLISEKADGDFLWVYYVIHKVCRAIGMYSDLALLIKRIQALPKEMSSLYSQMWQMQNEDFPEFSKDAGDIFAFGDHFPMPLFQLKLALDEGLCQSYLDTLQPMSAANFDTQCGKMAAHVERRTAGLIELVLYEDYDDQAEDALMDFSLPYGSRIATWRRLQVRFIHRSVLDFLKDTEEGKSMSQSTLDYTHINRAWALSYIAAFVEDVRLLSRQEVFSFIYNQNWTHFTHDNYILESFDRTCTRLAAARVKQIRPQDNWVTLLIWDDTILDFAGLVIGSSVACAHYVLSAAKVNLSVYYPGYLAMRTVLHAMSLNYPKEADFARMFEILEMLKKAGADLDFQYPYRSRDEVLTIRSPNTRLLLEVSTRILDGTHRELTLQLVLGALSHLGSASLEGQKLTLCKTISSPQCLLGHWSSCCSSEPSWIVEFEATSLYKALKSMLQTCGQPHTRELE